MSNVRVKVLTSKQKNIIFIYFVTWSLKIKHENFQRSEYFLYAVDTS